MSIVLTCMSLADKYFYPKFLSSWNGRFTFRYWYNQGVRGWNSEFIWRRIQFLWTIFSTYEMCLCLRDRYVNIFQSSLTFCFDRVIFLVSRLSFLHHWYRISIKILTRLCGAKKDRPCVKCTGITCLYPAVAASALYFLQC